MSAGEGEREWMEEGWQGWGEGFGGGGSLTVPVAFSSRWRSSSQMGRSCWWSIERSWSAGEKRADEETTSEHEAPPPFPTPPLPLPELADAAHPSLGYLCALRLRREEREG